MSIPYYSSTDFDTARPNQDSWIEFPFINLGDSSTKVYHLKCTMLRSDYNPALVPLDTTMASAANAQVTSLPFTANASAYFVGDYDHSISDGVLITFDRQFATIPQKTFEPAGSEIFTFPGLPATVGTNVPIGLLSLTTSGQTRTLQLALAHGMAAGDNFRFYIKGTYGTGLNFGVSIFGNSVCKSPTSGSTITFVSYLPTNFTLASGNVIPFATRGRKQVSRKATTQLENDYFLPGISPNVATSQSIPLPQKFEAYYYAEGNTIESLNSTTTPSSEDYNALVDSDGFLVLDSGISVWKGNIIRRTVKSIRAI